MVGVLKECLETGDTDGATKAFEVFDTLLILVGFLKRWHLIFKGGTLTIPSLYGSGSVLYHYCL